MNARLIFHPLLLGAAPLLLLFSHNRQQASLEDLALPLVVVLACVTILWMAAGWLLGRSSGSLLVSGTVVAFFSFGHVRQWLERHLRGGVGTYEDMLLVILFSLAVLLLAVYVTRRRIPASVHASLGAASLALVCLPLASILVGQLSAAGEALSPEPRTSARDGDSALPDIYYIVLDGYGQSDVLREYFGYDNRDFLAFLREENFEIVDRARTNYSQTKLALASTLNYTHLHDIAEALGTSSRDRRPLEAMIKKSRLASFLRRRGYEIVAFETGYEGTEMEDADRYLTPGRGVSEFSTALLNLTPAPLLMNRFSRTSPFAIHRRRIEHILDELPELARQPGPRFVFAHVMAPHPPFVFDSEGRPAKDGGTFRFQDGSHYLESSSRSAYVSGYREQADYLTRRLRESLSRLLEASEATPVIVIQGDHGPGSRLDHGSLAGTDLVERMHILSAYHLPGVDEEAIYSDMTPVNAFRVVMNSYFGQDLPMLPDRSFFSTWPRPYALHDVTDTLSAVSWEWDRRQVSASVDQSR